MSLGLIGLIGTACDRRVVSGTIAFEHRTTNNNTKKNNKFNEDGM